MAILSHDVPYPKECVERILALLAAGQLRQQWKEAISCLLQVAAYVASRMQHADSDRPIVFGGGAGDFPTQLADLAMALEESPLPVGGIRDVVLQAVLKRILTQLVELLASRHQEVIDWIADNLLGDIGGWIT